MHSKAAVRVLLFERLLVTRSGHLLSFDPGDISNRSDTCSIALARWLDRLRTVNEAGYKGR
jgi:hypothetical protein